MFPMTVLIGAAMRKIANEKAHDCALLDVPNAVIELHATRNLTHAARINRTIHHHMRWTAIARLGQGRG